jgi:hypothetical protein
MNSILSASESVAAIALYLGIACLGFGAIRFVRASVERNERDRAGLALAATGLALLVVALVSYATGPRHVLPF